MSEENLEQRTEWRNLAPALVRQRLIIEAYTREIVKPDAMEDFLVKLADVVRMEILSGPYAYSAHELGFGGWVHWRTSGAHIYSYPKESPFGVIDHPLLTVDVYTCKPLDPEKVVEFTRDYFRTLDIVWKEIEV